MLAIAERLEGLYSNASTHAAGVVIGDRPLIELVPLYRDPKSAMPATQFNMKWVEPAGLVKFDFLGLKTLTVLKRAVDLIARRGIAIDLSKIPLDDEKTYEMLGRGETVGVFQVESGGMRKALVDMRADRFEDLIALVALYRPGPMANIPAYCARKLGEEKVEYAHPLLEPILKETYRRHHLSGAGDADRQGRWPAIRWRGRHAAPRDGQEDQEGDGRAARALRRRRGRARHRQADRRRDLRLLRQIRRLRLQQVATPRLTRCIAYQTAWFKANHPAEFLAASMTLDKGNTDKLAEFRAEAQRLGIKVMAPSVNESLVDFDVRERRPARRRSIMR